MSHYDDDELLRYADDPSAFDDSEMLETHISGCQDCSYRLDIVTGLEERLRDQATWKLVEEVEQPVTPSAALLEYADRLERERIEARQSLSSVIVSPVAFARAAIDRDSRFHTSAVVEVLCSAAEGARERQPRYALQLADVAIFIARKLHRQGLLWTPSLLGRAWTERMVALGIIGRFHEAEEAADHAERAYDEDPLPTPHEVAIVWLNRSVICVETGRLPQAQFFATAAARQFEQFGDRTLLLKARLASGNILSMRRQHEDAAEQLESVVHMARRGEDRLLLVRAVQSLGESHVALGRFGEALRCFAESHSVADEIGAALEKMRAIWSLGNVLLQVGEYAEALEHFMEARRGFEALEVVNDAALVRLQLAEALLLSGRPHEVPDVLAGIAVTFAAEGMTENANLAIAYAREAAAAGRADAALLRNIRSYLEELPRHPDRPFSPPA